jgi:hypothetical protein
LDILKQQRDAAEEINDLTEKKSKSTAMLKRFVAVHRM